MQWLGNTSFGFYMCQGVVIFFLRQAMHNNTFPTPLAVLVVIGFFLMAIVGGWILYTFVEKPTMDRFARPRRQPVMQPLERVTDTAS